MDAPHTSGRGRACFCLSHARPRDATAHDHEEIADDGLGGLKFSALQQRASASGISSERLEEAMDSPAPRQALVALLRDSAAAGSEPDNAATSRRRKQLANMKLSQLQREAAAAVSPAALEAALDDESPAESIVVLILDAERGASRESSERQRESRELLRRELLRRELASLKLAALQRRALAVGVSSDAVDEAVDADDAKQALTELILQADVQHEPTPESAAPPKAAAQLGTHLEVDTPHFGTNQPRKSKPVCKQELRAGLLPPNKHAMISYQWDEQERVIAARETLAKLGVPCWMDIDGGMQQDIYESMAAGVENAACVVCFLTQKYQDSENCKLELKFAKQSGVPIVPVMVESTRGWRPSGWLGIVVAGALWTSLCDESEFDSSIRSLVEQIKGAVPGSGVSEDDDEEDDSPVATDAGAELRAELDRLRDVLAAKEESQTAGGPVLADPSQPAMIPAGVPHLPQAAAYQATEQIKELTRLVLSTAASDMRMSRVGFWGMGGIGKTVTGAAIARDDGVRDHFHAIVWLPLGQTPVLSKLQNLSHMQCTGKELSADLSSEEKKQALQQAMSGKRVLLCLDDLWEEEHESALNLVDVSAGSKVLISTRMKALLAGGHQVEVGLPSPSDSVRMLLAAAGAEGGSDSDTGVDPTGLSEIVDLCGRLPLALGIAGRLAASLGLVDAPDWSGMVGVLQEELRESHSGGAEEGTIRASLRGLKGSAKEQGNVRSLLLMFAFVPEDTHCPLEVLLLIFESLHKDSGATMMHIRKWLRILINRTLVLGTIDRPSVHDLVLDFAEAQYTDHELREGHRAVVETFRQARPEDAHGRRRFDKTVMIDPIDIYVCHEIGHHIGKAMGAGQVFDDERVVSDWLGDMPPDEIVHAVGQVLGIETLSELASQAESAGDWWMAARYWGVQAQVHFELEGPIEPLAVESRVKCLDAIAALASGSSYAQTAQAPNQEDLEDLHLEQIAALAAGYDFAGEIAKRPDEVRRVLASGAASREPIDAAITNMMRMMPFVMGGDAVEVGRILLEFTLRLCAAGHLHPDLATRHKCLVMAYGLSQMSDTVMAHPDFDWDSFYGEDGATLAEAAKVYDYDRHHEMLNAALSADFIMVGPALSFPFAVHWGDIPQALENLDTSLMNVRRTLDSSDNADHISRFFACTQALCVYATELDRHEAAAGMLEAGGFTWSTTDATVEGLRGVCSWMRPFGDTTMDGGLFHTAELCSLISKCSYLLLSKRSIPAETVMRELPTVEEAIKSIVHTTEGGSLAHSFHTFFNAFIAVALVYEKIGRPTEALEWATAGLSKDLSKGGTTLPVARVLFQSIQGRALAALGRGAEAGIAFEAAADEAERFGLRLYQAYAYRDQKLLVLDQMGQKQGEHGSRRLGEVLRLLTGPAASLQPLMKGLSAAKLMALPAPEAGYGVKFEVEEPTDRKLRAELSAMKLKALKKRAGEMGVDEEQLEDADDADNVRDTVIKLILEAARPTDDNAAELSAESSAQPRSTSVRARSKVLAKSTVSPPRPVKARVAAVRTKAPAKNPAEPQMRLRVVASNTFAESRDFQVPVVRSVDALVKAVGVALGANVIEVLIWDADFGEYHKQSTPPQLATLC